jgi:hypothetical protein
MMVEPSQLALAGALIVAALVVAIAAAILGTIAP